MRDASPRLFFLINDVARLARKRFEQLARESGLGLTRAQASVLFHLARQQGINQAALAQLMELEPITLVRLLDRLQERGLIERRADPCDRRAYRLHLTETSQALLRHAEQVSDRLLGEAVHGLDGEATAALRASLGILRENLLDRLIDVPAARPATSVAAHG